jgi:hypothetical protein
MSLFGGGEALRRQQALLSFQEEREASALRWRTRGVNDARLDMFEKDRLSELAREQALEQLNTPGALVLLGETPGEDQDLARLRRAGFYAQPTSATVAF